jgi:hypothetical protein
MPNTSYSEIFPLTVSLFPIHTIGHNFSIYSFGRHQLHTSPRSRSDTSSSAQPSFPIGIIEFPETSIQSTKLTQPFSADWDPAINLARQAALLVSETILVRGVPLLILRLDQEEVVAGCPPGTVLWLFHNALLRELVARAGF